MVARKHSKSRQVSQGLQKLHATAYEVLSTVASKGGNQWRGVLELFATSCCRACGRQRCWVTLGHRALTQHPDLGEALADGERCFAAAQVTYACAGDVCVMLRAWVELAEHIGSQISSQI